MVLAVGRGNMNPEEVVFLFSLVAAIIMVAGMKYGDWKSSRRGK